MSKVEKSTEEKCIATELIQENKVDVLQNLIATDELNKAFQQCKCQQI
jgi:hypothetical protein